MNVKHGGCPEEVVPLSMHPSLPSIGWAQSCNTSKRNASQMRQQYDTDPSAQALMLVVSGQLRMAQGSTCMEYVRRRSQLITAWACVNQLYTKGCCINCDYITWCLNFPGNGLIGCVQSICYSLTFDRPDHRASWCKLVREVCSRLRKVKRP